MSSQGEGGERKFPVANAARVAQQPMFLSVGNKERKAVVISLPGAITSQSKSFEGGESESSYRDPNMLPGAIGSSGAFDHYALVPAGKDSSSSEDMPKTDKSIKKEKSEGNEMEAKREGDLNISAVQELKKSESIDKSQKSEKSSSSSAEISLSKSTKRKTNKPMSETKDTKVKIARGPSRDGAENGAIEKPIHTGRHPMNRDMEELQVAGSEGPPSEDAVRSAYKKLIKAYLAPFARGIKRQAFFEILRRRTYSLAPPGANKGIQTILFQIIDKRKWAQKNLQRILTE